MDINPEGVKLRVNLIRLRWIVELLQDIPRTHTPPFGSNRDECGRLVMCLEEKV
jgi:hypothetical protein